VIVRYTPDIYQGVIIKKLCQSGRKISILCFYTGSFILTGVQQPCELESGLVFLLDMHSILPYLQPSA
jgi:TATA-box binding protein (TBP) (component of TFIID and TFIIIB)